MTPTDKPLVWLHGEAKTTRATPKRVLEECGRRLRQYDAITRGA
jgi:hypothetical protein